VFKITRNREIVLFVFHVHMWIYLLFLSFLFLLSFESFPHVLCSTMDDEIWCRPKFCCFYKIVFFFSFFFTNYETLFRIILCL